MEQLNQIDLRGIVGSARVSRLNDKDVLNASVVTNLAKIGDDGSAIIESTWHKVVCIDEVDAFKGIEKGSHIYVQGRIRNVSYTACNGEVSNHSEVIAHYVKVLHQYEELPAQDTKRLKVKVDNEEVFESLTDYCKDWIKLHIEDRIDQTHYACDLAYALTEGPNCDGSCTYSTYKAKRYLQAWWDDCADYLEYEKFNFGEVMHNPFDNPEAFMVCMLIEGVGSLLAKCKTIDDAWNDELTLTREVIDKILEEVDEFDVEF